MDIHCCDWATSLPIVVLSLNLANTVTFEGCDHTAHCYVGTQVLSSGTNRAIDPIPKKITKNCFRVFVNFLFLLLVCHLVLFQQALAFPLLLPGSLYLPFRLT